MALYKLRGKKHGEWSTFTGKLNRIYDVYFGVVRTDDSKEPQSSQVLRENHGAVPYDPAIHGPIPQVVRQLDPLEAAIQGQAARDVTDAQARASRSVQQRLVLPGQPMTESQLAAAERSADGNIHEQAQPAVTLAEG